MPKFFLSNRTRLAIAKLTRASRRCAASWIASIRRLHALDSPRNAPVVWTCTRLHSSLDPSQESGNLLAGESQSRQESPFPNHVSRLVETRPGIITLAERTPRTSFRKELFTTRGKQRERINPDHKCNFYPISLCDSHFSNWTSSFVRSDDLNKTSINARCSVWYFEISCVNPDCVWYKSDFITRAL